MLCTGETVSVVCAGACGLRPVSLWYDCTTAPACTTTRSHHFQYHHTRAPTPPRVPLHRTRTRHRAPLAPAPLPAPPHTPARDTARHRIHAPTPLPRAKHRAPFTCARHRHNELHRAYTVRLHCFPARDTAPRLRPRKTPRATSSVTTHPARHRAPSPNLHAHTTNHTARETPLYALMSADHSPDTYYVHLLCPNRSHAQQRQKAGD